MPGFEIREKLPRRANLPPLHAFDSLTDAFVRMGASGNIEQALVSLGVLHDGRRFAFHREHHGALGLLKLFHEVPGPPAKGCQRLHITLDVKHWTTAVKAPF